ncbi:ComEC family competence protein [Chryseobacterium salipaludis]|uniref:ComEC/Rec2 family competence protein n=1 Tax=Chryseobacterium TaxID=59732 RepID=UPI001FF4176F|nr:MULTISPECIES: ComEC/Rec2 family competence protein [Chryseobacterium]MCJ8498469.1 ComEC family competence protein [Chryseobacterium salipaludis]MCX3297206.1 ComEC/Rec2 family competence protein [Planobacterium sp. JC490]
MQRQPLFILCIGFVTGIFLQDIFHLSGLFLVGLVGAGLLGLSIFFIKNFLAFRLRPAFLVVFFITLGMVAHGIYSERTQLPPLPAKATILFKLNKKLNNNERNRRYEVDAWHEKQHFTTLLSVPKEQPSLDFKHYYRAEVYLNTVQKPYHDFQFDYAKYLARKGIYYQAYVPAQLQLQPRADLSVAERIRQARLELLHKIDGLPLSPRTREFTKGIILADRSGLDSETVRDFRNSGTMHILAISGTHMAVIFGLILWILNRLLPPRFRTFKIIAALCLIWAFAIFIDYGNSVVRSCIMVTVYFIFILLRRTPDLLHSMSLAAFVILSLDSNQLFDVGFQLSFSAVLGIYWLNGPLLKRLPAARNKIQNLLLNIVSISIAAQASTLPLVIYYFHQYSFVSLPANLVIIPFAEMVIIFSLIIVLSAALSLPVPAILWLYDHVISLVLKAVHYFGNANFALTEQIPMTLPELILAALLVYFLRPLIQKFSIKNISRFAFVTFVYAGTALLLNYRASLLNEILLHPFYREKVISVKDKNFVTFYLRESSDRVKIQQYIIAPYLTSRRTKKFEIKIIPAGTQEVRFGKKIFRLED